MGCVLHSLLFQMSSQGGVVVAAGPGIEDCFARRMLRAALRALCARFVVDVALWRWGIPHSSRHVCSENVATPECDTTITVSLTSQPAS